MNPLEFTETHTECAHCHSPVLTYFLNPGAPQLIPLTPNHLSLINQQLQHLICHPTFLFAHQTMTLFPCKHQFEFHPGSPKAKVLNP